MDRRQRFRALRSVEAAAIAGLAHSGLSLAATALLLDAPDPADGDAELAAYLNDSSNQARAVTAVNLLAISTIAFLWFVAVIRRRVGERENRFFGTVFFGSALLLSGSWLVAGVLFATPAIATQRFDIAPDAGSVAVLQSAGLTMASMVATRLEAVFIISTTTVGRLSGAFPRWLIVAGYVVGLTLLLVPVPNTFKTGEYAGRGELYVNGELVDEVDMPEMHISTYSLAETFDIGRDTGTQVDPTYGGDPFPFTGHLDKVVITLTGARLPPTETDIEFID